MGAQWTPPWIPVPTDVPPCCCNWLKQIWLHYLLGPERTITQMRPGGRTYCHGTYSPQLHYCKTGFVWGNDGTSKGCPPMGPGGSNNAWRKDGTDELLHQPAMLWQLENCWRSPAMTTAGGLPERCMPHLRCQMHVIGQRGWIMTTPLYQHIFS